MLLACHTVDKNKYCFGQKWVRFIVHDTMCCSSCIEVVFLDFMDNFKMLGFS